MVYSPELTGASVVDESFQLFRHGTILSQRSTTGAKACLATSKAQHQLVFLRTAMADDVVLGELRGVNVLLEQWRRYSAYFDDLQVQLELVTKTSPQLLRAFGTLSVTITKVVRSRTS